MKTPPSGSRLEPIYLKLPTENIVLLKAIVESHEGLAELRTLDPERGEVVLLAVADTLVETKRLVLEIADSLCMREVPAPEDLRGDWLLSEFYAESDG